MNNDQFVIGTDYGTDSVRSVIVNARDGKEVATSVFFTRAGSNDNTAMLPITSSGSTRLIMLKGWNIP